MISNTTATTTMPRITGRTPLSPLRTRSHQARRYWPSDWARSSGGTSAAAASGAAVRSAAIAASAVPARVSAGSAVTGISRSRPWAQPSPLADPAGSNGCPPELPVVMYSTTLCRSKSAAGPSATIRPRNSTAIRSATSKTSFRLCEITITASPRSRSRLTRSSTTRVCTTPRAAVGSSSSTSLELHRVLVEQAAAQALPAEEHVLDDVQVVGQRQILVDGLDPQRGGVPGTPNMHRSAFEVDLTMVRLVHAGDSAGEHRLPGTVVPTQAGHLARGQVQVHPVERLHRPEVLLDAPHLQQGFAPVPGAVRAFRGLVHLSHLAGSSSGPCLSWAPPLRYPGARRA